MLDWPTLRPRVALDETESVALAYALCSHEPTISEGISWLHRCLRFESLRVTGPLGNLVRNFGVFLRDRPAEVEAFTTRLLVELRDPTFGLFTAMVLTNLRPADARVVPALLERESDLLAEGKSQEAGLLLADLVDAYSGAPEVAVRLEKLFTSNAEAPVLAAVARRLAATPDPPEWLIPMLERAQGRKQSAEIASAVKLLQRRMKANTAARALPHPDLVSLVHRFNAP